MTLEVKLYKKNVKFKDQNGEEKTGRNFYLNIGDEFVPINVCYFPNDKCEGRDPNFAGRVSLVSACAEWMPEKSRKQTSEGNERKP